MRASEWVARSFVFSHIKLGRDETRDIVTTLAAAAVGTISKLPEVNIAVAIAAIGKSQWLGEIAATVTFFARYLLVQSEQRKTRHRMIE